MAHENVVTQHSLMGEANERSHLLWIRLRWIWHHQAYSGLGAGIVMESISKPFDLLWRDICQFLSHSVAAHLHPEERRVNDNARWDYCVKERSES
jgi:hypothetical protein